MRPPQTCISEGVFSRHIYHQLQVRTEESAQCALFINAGGPLAWNIHPFVQNIDKWGPLCGFSGLSKLCGCPCDAPLSVDSKSFKHFANSIPVVWTPNFENPLVCAQLKAKVLFQKQPFESHVFPIEMSQCPYLFWMGWVFPHCKGWCVELLFASQFRIFETFYFLKGWKGSLVFV